jgi:hypothetical protein
MSIASLTWSERRLSHAIDLLRSTPANSARRPSPVVFAPVMLGNEWIGRDPMLTQCLRGTRLVEPHEPTVADDIGGKDRGEAADRGHRVPGGQVPCPSLPRNRWRP